MTCVDKTERQRTLVSRGISVGKIFIQDTYKNEPHTEADLKTNRHELHSM